MSKLTQRRLKELLDYNPATGEFFWKVARHKVKVGDRAGGIGSKDKGYWDIGIDGKRYRAHRLAWFYVHGKWSKLDHKNRDPLDNRISNLREASNKQNQGNRKINQNNRSGLKGVIQFRKKWRAQIGHNSKVIWLGDFLTPELAHQAYCEKAKELFGEFFCDGVV